MSGIQSPPVIPCEYRIGVWNPLKALLASGGVNEGSPTHRSSKSCDWMSRCPAGNDQFTIVIVSWFISPIPICSMYGIFTYMWLKFMVNVGKCSIHGAFGIYRTYRTYFYRDEIIHLLPIVTTSRTSLGVGPVPCLLLRKP